MSFRPKRWLVYPHDASQVRDWERNLKVSPLMGQLLARRAFRTCEEAQRFLDPKLSDLRSPQLLPGVPQAVDTISQAVVAGKKIVVYGDYDADGMTATAILVRCLELLGARVTYFVPNRIDDGYGLNPQSLQSLAERGAELVITVDCGIASLECARLARERGLSLVISDHHQFGPELPLADAIVHPALPGHDYPFAGLCGAGVALKLAWALCQRFSNSERVLPLHRDFLMMALGLAALGTVCDVVPLLDENRVIVRYGLAALLTHPCLGIDALRQVCKLGEAPRLSAEDLAFSLGPRLNSAGRLGQAQLGVELLTTSSPPRAQALADYLHQLNQSRDSLDRSVYLGALRQIKDLYDADADEAFVLADHDWHSGVIGLVAGRLVEKFHRPTILIALDPLGAKPGMGSGRSIDAVSLYEALEHCGDHLLGFGGHAGAAGFKIEPAAIERFREAFRDYVAARSGPADWTADLHVDVETLFRQLTLPAIQEIERLAPFGQGNPRPVFCANNVQLAEPPKCVGASQRHLSLRLTQQGVGMKAVAFGRADWAEHLSDLTQPLDVAFRPMINTFHGFSRVELHLLDWRQSRSTLRVETSATQRSPS